MKKFSRLIYINDDSALDNAKGFVQNYVMKEGKYRTWKLEASLLRDLFMMLTAVTFELS